MVFRVDYDKLNYKIRITVNGENLAEYRKIESIDEVPDVLRAYIINEM